jgi:hypothetical protein
MASDRRSAIGVATRQRFRERSRRPRLLTSLATRQKPLIGARTHWRSAGSSWTPGPHIGSPKPQTKRSRRCEGKRSAKVKRGIGRPADKPKRTFGFPARRGAQMRVRARDEQITDTKRCDQFNDERWSFPLAAAWVIWRSKERVAQLLSDITESEGRVQVFDIFNDSARRENGRGGPSEGGVLPFVEAQAQLWGRLKQGRLVARGLKVGEASWSDIPASDWLNLDYFPCPDGRSNSIGSNHTTVYDEVTVPRSAVLKIWPSRSGKPRRRGRPPRS